jgi:hypothetical protein
MHKSLHLWTRMAAAGLGGAAAGTLVGAVGFMLGEEWFGTSLFFFQPTPGLGGLVGTLTIGGLGGAVGILVGALGGRFAVLNAVVGGGVGLAVVAYEVLVNAARFTAYELTFALTALVGCFFAGLAGGALCQRLSNRDTIPPASTHPPDRNSLP